MPNFQGFPKYCSTLHILLLFTAREIPRLASFITEHFHISPCGLMSPFTLLSTSLTLPKPQVPFLKDDL